MQVEQHGALLGLQGFAGTRVALSRHSNVHLLGYTPHGLRKRNVLDLLNKGKNVAACPTPKTVKELTGGMHRKGGRFLFMEGTQTRKVLRSRFLEGYVVANDADNVRLLL